MAVISRSKLDHPALGFTGGSSLHTLINKIYEQLGNQSGGRFNEFTSIANDTVVEIDHNYGVNLSELRVLVYSGSHPSLTRIFDPELLGTPWTIAEKSGSEKTVLEITTPDGGGPHTFTIVTIQGAAEAAALEGPGIIPLGTIIPIHDGGANVSLAATGVADSNGLQFCDGAALDGGHLMGAGISNVPDLSDDRFLMGTTLAGTAGTSAGSNTLLDHTHSSSLTSAAQTWSQSGTATAAGQSWSQSGTGTAAAQSWSQSGTGTAAGQGGGATTAGTTSGDRNVDRVSNSSAAGQGGGSTTTGTGSAHAHGISDPGHFHTTGADGSWQHLGGFAGVAGTSVNTGSKTTGITINNESAHTHSVPTHTHSASAVTGGNWKVPSANFSHNHSVPAHTHSTSTVSGISGTNGTSSVSGISGTNGTSTVSGIAGGNATSSVTGSIGGGSSPSSTNSRPRYLSVKYVMRVI